MPLYEHVVMGRHDISPQQMESLIEKFGEVITTGGGKVVNTEYWGLKHLAYRIKKNRKAHFTMLRLDTPPEALAEMERQMKLNTDIIRHLTVKVDEHESEQSVMMRKEKDDRRGGKRPPRGDRGGDSGGGRF